MKKEDLKIVFMGTSIFAKEIFNALLRDKYNILAVFTQPDKKSGRKQEFKASPVKELADTKNIKVFQPKKLDEDTISKVKELDPDLIVVAAYGKIIPNEILNIPKFKNINIHPSLLPKFRGPSPIQNAILSGEVETGATIMLMDEKVDHGDILARANIKINPDDTAERLTEKIIPISSKLLLDTIPAWIEGKIKPEKQDDSKATYCQLIEREDGHVFWNEDAVKIFNKFRALNPWPGIFSLWRNNGSLIRIKLLKIRIQENNSEEKNGLGEVFKSAQGIGVQSEKGIVYLEELQVEGKKPTSIDEFINGYPNFVGITLK